MAEKVLFESQSLYFSYNTAFGVYVSVDNPPPFSLVIGEKYKILWDGTEYETTAIDTSAVMPNTVGAGNGAAWGYAGNNEPFVILYTEGNDISFISLTDTAPNTHTVSVYQMVEDVVVEDAILYTVSSTSLKKVADAIREKSGSADPIAFPDGFVQKISSISGGGGGSSADVRYVTFMNGDTVLYKKPVAVGDDCVDVLTKGLISTPTKESDVQYNYTYYGWGATDNGAADANILKNITEDKTVYAIYTSTVRSYTITYLDDDGSVLKTETLTYGTVPSYAPHKDGFAITWSPELATVTADATYTAVWEVSTIVNSGKCGDNVTWTLKTDGTLTISGTGAMTDYTTFNGSPLYAYREDVTKLIVEEGVTSIGSYAFYKCYCNSVELPASLTKIGTSAFQAARMTSFVIPDGVTRIEYGVFGQSYLESVTIGSGVVFIDTSAVQNTSKFTEAIFKVTTGWKYSASETGSKYTLTTDLTNAETAASAMKTAISNNRRYWHRT